MCSCNFTASLLGKVHLVMIMILTIAMWSADDKYYVNFSKFSNFAGITLQMMPILNILNVFVLFFRFKE